MQRGKPAAWLGGWVVLLLAAFPWTAPVAGQDAPRISAPFPLPEFTPPNIPTVTLGGEQFWSDELVRNGWRVQLNVMTGHHRLLDNKDVRRCWGTHDQCQAKLLEFAREEGWPALKPHAVITLHGLIRSREAMEGIGGWLQKELDCEWINISYASTRRSIDEHAACLAKVINGLEGVERIDFVCHSMGNIVVRRYLGEATATEPKWKVDSRIHRFVMLAPPNQGAELARRFKGNKLVAMILGQSGKQLGAEWETFSSKLAIPSCEFGIIAGGNGTEMGASALIKGDDDFVVSVEETRLPGARDFRTVNLLHGQLMNDPQVRNYVLKFLKEGYFESAETRQPIR
jgi:hypothetical protein